MAADQSNRGWVEHWARVGPELERIRREELRRYRHEDNIEIMRRRERRRMRLATDDADERG